MVSLIKHDLEFILKQIEIAEAHAAGGDLAQLVAGYNGNDGLAQAHLLPYGLRTVDGSYNNLLPGRENWGAADQSFPGIFEPSYMNDADGDRYDFNPLPNMETWYTNNDYGNAGTRTGSQPGPGSGTVIDADPRIISNLIVDQTLNNPAAIAAALTHAGMSGQPLLTALSVITNAFQAVAPLAAAATAATAAATVANTAAINAAAALQIAQNDPDFDPAGLPALESAAASTAAAATAAFIAADQANDNRDAAETDLATALETYAVEMDGKTVYLPAVAPDEGLSSPFNGWMTIFGQFFDHGLDLVAKGGNGTVYVPLAEDDPLYVPGGQNYIPLTRVTVNPGADGILGTDDDGPGPKNLTTPWVDQNQTYASTASKQVFMREYVAGPDGKPIASGLLLEGSNGGLATWADIKEQARTVLGIELTDLNVGNIPLIAADAYGNFIPGANGYPQLVVGMGADGQLGTSDDVLREGNPAAPVSAQGVVLTGHAFLDDIAHAAVPVVSGGALVQDSDSALGYANADGTPGPQGQRGPTAYDNELLDRHFIAGDGRVNENIALTAVHQVFHAEHNRVVEMTKQVALDSGDLAFLNEWLLVDVAAMPVTPGEVAALVWDGERLFQAGRFTNEMEYQHLVFEEFGRMMQPDIDAFVFEPSADINPSIAAEFAHVVYRFGHSMLRQDIAVIAMDENGNPIERDVSLFDGFLNPVMYDSLGDAEAASGAIIRGMSRQTGSEIDEFVTDVLRNQLLGIPLDLATINIARGRDVGMPSLQTARQTFFDETGDTLLKPYESWADFALNLKNPASIINFIAAYGTHASVLNTPAGPKTVEQLRDAATKLVLGDSTLTGQAKVDFDADRLDFLNATGIYAGDAKLGGLNDIDFWMGGLAEKKMAFGGMLGSTFAFVFQMTMENLQDADRFYYLSRTQGLNLLNELENNTFAELVMRNTNLGDDHSTALPGNLFSAFDMPQLEMDISKQLGADPTSDDPFLGGFSKLIERVDANGDGIAEYIRVNSNEHFVIGGTEGNDTIVAGGGDDAIWGKGGNDTIEAGYGVDKVFGGEGDDIITNAGTDIGEADFLHGNEGNDVIHGGSGLSLIFGNQGNDFIVTGPDGKEAFGGTGNDFILGGSGGDFLLGNEGDDWLEGGQRFDTLAGENSELFFNSTIVGHDVMNGGSGDTDYDGESGDDIMFQNSEGIQRSNGMAGFDWAVHKGDSQSANSNLGIPIFESQEAFILRDRFDLVEGLSGWKHDDNLTGRRTAVNTRAEIEGTAAIPNDGSTLDSFSNDLLAKNVALINGLAPLVAHLGAGIPVTRVVNGVTVPVLDENGVQERIVFSTADASDILLGGGGSDIITGLAGNDIIDGDNWLNVRIRFVEDGVAYTTDSMEGLVYREVDYVNGAPAAGAVAQFGGRELDALLFDRTVNPGQLEIIREIVDGDIANVATDIAVFTDIRANYTITRNADGSFTVDHTGFSDDTPDGGVDDDDAEGDIANKPMSDGADRLFNIEVLRFADGDVLLTPPSLELDGFDTVARNWADNFSPRAYTNNSGSANFNGAWAESGDGNGSATAGSVQITAGGTLTFGSGNADNASVTRAFNLSGATGANATFSISDTSVGGFLSFDNEEILFEFAADGVNFVTLRTFNGENGGNISVALPTNVAFGANAAIRFRANNTLDNGESFSVDNLTINATFVEPANPPSVNISTTYVEDAGAVAIASDPRIVEDSGALVSARIVLTNAQAGDRFNVPGNLPGNINSTVTNVAGTIVVLLSGTDSVANYQAAIQAIRFETTGEPPSTVDRIVEVTVNDGFLDSNVARTTVSVVSVDDPINANNDTVITNISGTAPIVVPEWALLRNDVDPDSVTDITSVQGANGLNGLSLATVPGSVTFTDPATGAAGGSFTYTATGAPGNTDTASVTVTRDATGTISGNNGNNIIVGSDAGNTFDAGEGDDIVFAGGGNDTIVWNATSFLGFELSQDGRDFADGGTGVDEFFVSGSDAAESFVVYARAAADANGITGLRPETEIVITRNGAVIAELDNIEEITIDTNGGNDTVTTVGNFSPTTLAQSTITINGTAADETIDISGMLSSHRIVFRSNGGTDTIVGTLRPQDVVELPAGADVADYVRTYDEETGMSTLSNGSHSICFAGDFDPATRPHNGDHDDEDDHDDDNDHDDDDDHDQDGGSCGDDDDDVVTPPAAGSSNIGTPQADALVGSMGDDVLIGLAGDDSILGGDGADAIHGGDGHDILHGENGSDVVFAGSGNDDVLGGAGADMLYGDAGNDRILGDDGNDLINGGAGNDTVFGGAGDDIFVAELGDGDDTYYGDDMAGGMGNDTLDMSAIAANITADLGTGFMGRGSVFSADTGNDTIRGFENFVGGRGNDTVTASNGVNVMDGGAGGNDTFRFLSASDANGDTILGFQPGDRIDLSMADGNACDAGKQSFELVTGEGFTDRGQLMVSHEVRDDGDYTIVHLNTSGGNAADYKFSIKGNHVLNESDFNL